MLEPPAETERQFAWLDHAPLVVAEQSLQGWVAPLLPEEAGFVAGAVSSRIREFAAGRGCARRALAALGVPPLAILVAEDRLPIWPEDVIGSITHGGERCAAAVARKGHGIRSIGIDLEPALPLQENLLEEICRREEIDWLSHQVPSHRLLLARAMFSAKESTYKCLYPISRTSLEFEALTVDLDLTSGRFLATLLRETPPFNAGSRVSGHVRISATHVATSATLAEDDNGLPEMESRAF